MDEQVEIGKLERERSMGEKVQREGEKYLLAGTEGGPSYSNSVILQIDLTL